MHTRTIFQVERQIPIPFGAARNIRRLFVRVARCTRITTAEIILRNVMQDTGDFVRIREVKA
jgi:hypothetical protein